RLARASAPNTSSNESRLSSPCGHSSLCSFPVALEPWERSTERMRAAAEIAEMAHQGGHAALAAFGITMHQIELLLLLLALRDVRLAPVVVAAADVFG